MTMRKHTRLACNLLPTLAGVSAAGMMIDPLIDKVQPAVVEYLSVGAGAAFAAAATFLTQRFGIKVFEYFNRQVIETAVKTFADSVIDMLQDRYTKSDNPEISDLVREGIEYVKSGNPDAIRQSGIDDNRLAVKVKAALNTKTEELIAKALVMPKRGS